MRSAMRWAALALIAASTSIPAYAASADAPLCDGQPATIVGTGSNIAGTDGPDVIITNGAYNTWAGTGDDTICVTGAFDGLPPHVVAGPGSDTVDTTAVDFRVDTYLGNQDPNVYGQVPTSPSDVDTYLGGPGSDGVYDPGGETVHISTGGGDDTVRNLSTSAGTTDLGPGDDTVLTGISPDVDARIDGGTGTNTLSLLGDALALDPADPDLLVDNRATPGTAYAGGTPVFQWTDFTSFVLYPNARDVRFLGGPRPEHLAFNYGLRGGHVDRVTAMMGAGGDEVLLGATSFPVDVDAGPGTDTIAADPLEGNNGSAHVHLDLTNGTLNFRTDDPSARLHGFEDASIVDRPRRFRSAHYVPIAVVGSPGANRVTVVGGSCTLRVDGRAGDDHITTTGSQTCSHTHHRKLSGGDGDDVVSGGNGTDLIFGGAGNDHLYGQAGQDHLDGGPGTDHAAGGLNVDTCVAEVERTCER